MPSLLLLRLRRFLLAFRWRSVACESYGCAVFGAGERVRLSRILPDFFGRPLIVSALHKDESASGRGRDVYRGEEGMLSSSFFKEVL